MSVKTPLGEDVLCIDRASISERISKPFGMQFEFLTDVANIAKVKHDQLIGKGVTLTLELPGEKKRHFNGMVNRFSAGGRDERFAYYRAEVVPWLWLLTLTSDCKVWQFKTVPEIIEDVFKEWQGKFSDLVKFENKLKGDYLKVDYCVQYRETDFNFISRLMEQEGICYFFKHDESGHTLVLGDEPSVFEACPHQEKARYLPEAGMGEWEDGVTSWEARHSMVPGKYTLADYHFQMSNKKFQAPSTGSVNIGNNAGLEIFDFPGEFAQRFNKPDERLGEVEKHAEAIAKWRMEEQAAAHVQLSGNSTCRAFTTGTHFELLGKDENPIKVTGTEGKYVLASCKHTIEQSPDYVTNAAEAQPYRNSFTCFPKETPYRPARTSPRPVIQGVQSAVVVGLESEEIDCDKYGRVKVQFHWDRQGEKNEKSSCWVRVATPLAGNKWGMIHIPRIGQEVIVSFLEGDPDQPLIVGSVYNFNNMPPFELDKHKTQSGIKTRSTKDGSEDNFNEICLEDKKGEELVYVRAEKDLTKAVKNNETVWIGNNRWEEVDNNEEVIVDKGDRTVTLNNGNDKHQLKMGNRDVLLDMGNDALTIKMGNQTTKLDLGKSETEALQSIELKVGQSSLKIDQMGITLKGMMITVEGQLLTEVKGLMTNVKGDGLMVVKGGLTMIN
jgi:type VI secretion system secreted protein VgrG